jgi:hypothetical protein
MSGNLQTVQETVFGMSSLINELTFIHAHFILLHLNANTHFLAFYNA